MKNTFNLKNINPSKLSISFSWDDNFLNHYNIIADIFKKHDTKCTFYICVGEDNFTDNIYHNYKLLLSQNFELGDHLYVHDSATDIPFSRFQELLKLSNEKWQTLFNETPSTFAFPYHASNQTTLDKVLTVYTQTRNTIDNTELVSLHSKSNINDTIQTISTAQANTKNIMFAGHSIIPSDEYTVFSNEDLGYEPVSVDFLNDTLSYISNNTDYQILTTEQAAIKSYILTNCKYDNSYVYFNDDDISFLELRGVNIHNLHNIL